MELREDVTDAGQTNERTTTTEDRATQPMEAGGWVSQLVFQFVKDKISSVNGDEYFDITNFSPLELIKHRVGIFAQSLRSMASLNQTTTVLKAH